MTDGPQLSCIIPAFNEAPRIGAVLAVALTTPEIDEVIVVDDGSTDATVAVVQTWASRHPKLRLIRQRANAGKTSAVAAGLRAAGGELVMLLDSDLVGLRAEHLSALARPVITGRAEATISLRGNAPKSWHWIGLDYISGERVMARQLLLQTLDTLDRLPRFGLEVYMNRLWLANNVTLAVVQWPDVQSPLKSAKRGSRLAGLKADLAMLADMFRTVSPFEALRQIVGLRGRRV